MLKRILLVAGFVFVLGALLVFSQWRQPPAKVSGYIEADDMRLGSRVGGRVAEVLVQEGQTIAAGAVLVRLEAYDLGERQQQAEAEHASRCAVLRRLQTGFRDEEIAQAAARVERLTQKVKRLVDGPRLEEIAAARSRQKLAQSQLDRAKLTYDRNAALFRTETGAVTRDVMDRSTEELKVAEAAKETRDQELQLLEKGTRAEEVAEAKAELAEAEQAWLLTKNGSRAEDIEQAQAAVAAAQAALDAILTQRAELEVKSPVGGIVDAVDLQPGDLVAAGAPVLSVIDTSRLWVRAYVPENRLQVKLGDQLSVTVDSFPNERFTGEVTYISRQAEFTPSNVQTPDERSKQVFRIKVTLKTGAEKLRPGMAADVWLNQR